MEIEPISSFSALIFFLAEMQVTFGSLSTSLSGQRGHLLISFLLFLLNYRLH